MRLGLLVSYSFSEESITLAQPDFLGLLLSNSMASWLWPSSVASRSKVLESEMMTGKESNLIYLKSRKNVIVPKVWPRA